MSPRCGLWLSSLMKAQMLSQLLQVSQALLLALSMYHCQGVAGLIVLSVGIPGQRPYYAVRAP